jgi:hypothetical protein
VQRRDWLQSTYLYKETPGLAAAARYKSGQRARSLSGWQQSDDFHERLRRHPQRVRPIQDDRDRRRVTLNCVRA